MYIIQIYFTILATYAKTILSVMDYLSKILQWFVFKLHNYTLISSLLNGYDFANHHSVKVIHLSFQFPLFDSLQIILNIKQVLNTQELKIRFRNLFKMFDN